MCTCEPAYDGAKLGTSKLPLGKSIDVKDTV